jgi:hypothetical protein
MAVGHTQPSLEWVAGALSPGVKQLGHEADHSLPSGTEVKNVSSYTSILPNVFMARCLVKQQIHCHGMVLKHRGNFTFIY